MNVYWIACVTNSIIQIKDALKYLFVYSNILLSNNDRPVISNNIFIAAFYWFDVPISMLNILVCQLLCGEQIIILTVSVLIQNKMQMIIALIKG